jgi:hypothetical protein
MIQAEPSPSPVAASGEPAIPARPWQWGIGPHYISLFLSILFFDRLGTATLDLGGLRAALVGVVIGGVLCFLLLYLPPALWGVRTRQPLSGLLAATFGELGGPRLAGLVLAVAQVLLFAAAVGYAADLSLRALVLLGLIGPDALAAARLGGPWHGGTVYLVTLLIWLPTAAVLGPILVHLVAAVMSVYVALPAVVFGITMIWALGGLSAAPPTGSGQLYLGGAMAVQLLFGFFAPAGAQGADWGAASREVRDVRLGGYVGVAMASVIVATIALVTVLGAEGRLPPQRLGEGTIAYRMIWSRAFRGDVGGIVTFVWTLALLGPACYAPTVGVRLLAEVWPGARRWLLGLLVAALAWPLAATGFALRLELVFGLIGALVAPLAGAMAAEFLAGTSSPPARRRVDPAAAVGWVAGLAAGLVPYVGPLLGASSLARVQPAAVLAFAVGLALAMVPRWPRALFGKA